MKRWSVLTYGLASYLIFFAVFLYAILFIGNLWIPNSLDSQSRVDWVQAVSVNLVLLVSFAIQHSGMARPSFKKWITRHIPEPAERSTFVLLSSVALMLVFLFWQPLGGLVWKLNQPFAVGALYGLYFLGWAILFVATCAISHCDLFGLRQVWYYFNGKTYIPYEFQIPGIYNYVRHPIYVGWLMIIWAAPTMTLSHLLFAVGMTAYILIGIQFEEKDLLKQFGRKYAAYRKRVPMLIPGTSGNANSEAFEESVQQKV